MFATNSVDTKSLARSAKASSRPVSGVSSAETKNRLYFGDNLAILREHVTDESVDLVYLDPPFNSNANYNVLFAEKSGRKSTAQITAFEDTWRWGNDAEMAYHETVLAGGKLADLLQALRSFLGQSDMMAYLVMMAPRLKELHRVLKPTGSLYLHCDPSASHYLKLLLDGIFGAGNFRNEIIWKRTSAHSSAKRYGPVHDVILFYGKADGMNWIGGYQTYDEAYVKQRFARGNDRPWKDADLTGSGVRHGETGEVWRGFDVTAKGRHWAYPPSALDRLDEAGLIYWPEKKDGWPRLKKYLEHAKGVPLQDVWTDISPINSQAQERLKYPTQKPEALLERIVKTSCSEGDIVLDPFCGCGTAVSIAEKLNRRWIGVDLTHIAISLIRHRLQTAFGAELRAYEVLGTPTDAESARALAEVDRYQFEWWACGLVDARRADGKKKGADNGIDGVGFFFDDGTNIAKKYVVQVKSGHVSRNMIGDLSHARQREKAEIALFVSLEEATEPMRKEAAACGIYQPVYFPQARVPRMQILTIRELLSGIRPALPMAAPLATFKPASPVRKPPSAVQGDIFGEGTG